MGRMGNFNANDLKKFQKELEKLNKNTDAFLQACAKELAARLLRMVIKRTPVGEYSKSSGKKGGTLRRGWTGGGSVPAKGYADSLEVQHIGDAYTVEIKNSTDYGVFVEYGHRTPDHKGWVPGRFMMTISERELEKIAPKVLERKLEKLLRSALH